MNGRVHYEEVSSSITDTKNGMTELSNMIRLEIEAFTTKVCESYHPNDCECSLVLLNHLLHAQTIYRTLNNVKKKHMRKLCIEGGECHDNQHWMYLTSLEMHSIAMACYVDKILDHLLTGLYRNGCIELIY